MIFITHVVYHGKTFFGQLCWVLQARFKRWRINTEWYNRCRYAIAGVFGAFLGNIQDKQIDSELKSQNPSIHSRIMGEEKSSVWGNYKPIDQIN